ncbi:hypothetical protein KIH77_08740 [Bifidobacterium sp. 82T24]|uniref:hypothetical protein n=1 Tax=Bifidobacterium pluvialisilvae TaxID=2834436 RepID=UPI001C58F005|nr:hypothetical protein [Bifidobacterium pluvialisilvae]MBW3088808.1 hypothetical protein [Bifidobacterium pluvialisilvae]
MSLTLEAQQQFTTHNPNPETIWLAYHQGYLDGARRPLTDEEVEAMAAAVYEGLKQPGYPGWDSYTNCADKSDYLDAVRDAVAAMRGVVDE